MENTIEFGLLEKLVDNQQKTIEHLLDQNAQLINLLTNMWMPTASVPTGTDAPVEIPEEEVDSALAGGMNS